MFFRSKFGEIFSPKPNIAIPLLGIKPKNWLCGREGICMRDFQDAKTTFGESQRQMPFSYKRI
jgi:hypothetical protein